MWTRIRASVTVAAALMAVAVANAGAAPAKPARPGIAIISEAELLSTLKKHKGKPVVLHFWATWCLPCIAELPEVASIARAAKERGVEFMAVSLDDPTPRAAAKVKAVLAEQLKSPFPTTILRIENADKFIGNIDPRWEGDIPAFFAYDKEGKLRRAFIGELKRADLDKFVGDLGGPPPR